MAICVLLSVRQKEGRELILCLFVNYLWLKIILMPEWHILRWHTVNPFTGAGGQGSTWRQGDKLQCKL